VEVNNQRGISQIIIGVIVLLLLGVGGSYYLYTKNQSSQIKPTPTSTPQTQATPAPIIPADWKTYTNTNGHFTMKYPPNFYTTTIPYYEAVKRSPLLLILRIHSKNGNKILN
jgi:hypothetical protein